MALPRRHTEGDPVRGRKCEWGSTPQGEKMLHRIRYPAAEIIRQARTWEERGPVWNLKSLTRQPANQWEGLGQRPTNPNVFLFQVMAHQPIKSY